MQRDAAPGKDQLPSTREVLSEHIHAKVTAILGQDHGLVAQVTGMLVDGSQSDLLALLADERLLVHRTQQALRSLQGCNVSKAVTMQGEQGGSEQRHGDGVMQGADSERRQALGNLLYDSVADIESELCAQITGMLLELPLIRLEVLLGDSDALESAVQHARLEYMREHHAASLPDRDQTAHHIYEAVMDVYPDHGPRITGMLLELELPVLHQLLESPTELHQRIQQAHAGLHRR